MAYENKTPVQALKIKIQELLNKSQCVLQNTERRIDDLSLQAQRERGEVSAYRDALDEIKKAFPEPS